MPFRISHLLRVSSDHRKSTPPSPLSRPHTSGCHPTSAPPLRRGLHHKASPCSEQQVLSKHHSPDPHRIPSNAPSLCSILLGNSHRLQGGRQLVQSHAAQQGNQDDSHSDLPASKPGTVFHSASPIERDEKKANKRRPASKRHEVPR